MRHLTSTFYSALLLFSLIGAPAVRAADAQSKDLFNGRNLSGWDTWLGAEEVPGSPIKLWGEWPPQIGLNKDTASVFSVVSQDGEPAIRISGQIWGGLISTDNYADYHLQLQYKWGETRYAPRLEKPRNTGLLYHSIGPHGAFWTYWMRSAEFEIMEGYTGDFTSVDGLSADIQTDWDRGIAYPWQRYSPMAKPTAVGGLVFRVKASADHEKPSGEWNTIDLFVHGSGSIHRVNGHTVLRAANLSHEIDGKTVLLNSGKLQLQSEGAEVYFRRIKLRPIDGLPAESSL